MNYLLFCFKEKKVKPQNFNILFANITFSALKSFSKECPIKIVFEETFLRKKFWTSWIEVVTFSIIAGVIPLYLQAIKQKNDTQKRKKKRKKKKKRKRIN